MKEIIYRVSFEDMEYFGDIAFYLKEIISPIRLEVGDKIALSYASFDRDIFHDLSNDEINAMWKALLKKSIKASKYYAYFETSDIVYNHEWYHDEDEFNFHGEVILRGK